MAHSLAPERVIIAAVQEVVPQQHHRRERRCREKSGQEALFLDSAVEQRRHQQRQCDVHLLAHRNQHKAQQRRLPCRPLAALDCQVQQAEEENQKQRHGQRLREDGAAVHHPSIGNKAAHQRGRHRTERHRQIAQPRQLKELRAPLGENPGRPGCKKALRHDS